VKKPAWPRVGPRFESPLNDPAPSVLARLAEGVERRASEALRRKAFATRDEPVCGEWTYPIGGRCRLWRTDRFEETPVWCIVGDASVSALLELILGGPGADRPTALERSIVTDAVERLLAAEDCVWEDVDGTAPPAARAWRCGLTIVSEKGMRAELSLVAPAVPVSPPPPAVRIDAGQIPLSLSASLAPVRMRLDSLMDWRAGSIVALNSQAEASIWLLAGSAAVANGRLGISRGRRAVRLEGLAQERSR
jgi:hypothetical protein